MPKRNYKKELSIKISYQLDNDGFNFFFDDLEKYSVKYPENIWREFGSKNILAENFIYARTAPLGVATGKKIFWTNRPFVKEIADYGVWHDLPQIAYVNGINVKRLRKKYLQQKNVFCGKAAPIKISLPWPKGNSAILAMSFGKDSLLSYGLMKELGMKFDLVYVNEMETANEIENEHKRKIIAKFEKLEKSRIVFITDDADNIFYEKDLDIKINNFDNTNGMLAFALEMMPMAAFFGAKYLILGNERNLNDFFYYQNFKAYPSFDQSSKYAMKLNKELNGFTGGKYQVASLIEGIYNLAEFKILYNRYPDLLQYWMSCDQKMTVNDKWCNNCPMCANAYLYSLAVGEDPAKIGMRYNLLSGKYKHLYPIFSGQRLRAYEMPLAVKEEQKLAFLLAYQNGMRGGLMDLFKSKYLERTKKQESILRRKFFMVYPPINAPHQYKKQLVSIFSKELKQLI